MRIAKHGLFILLFLLLQSCASPHHAEELQVGRSNFQSGNFKLAFHELLPLAANGNPCAAYAIGYMYYYGYGVPQDTESGLFWMRRAADCHYAPAIRALHIINMQERPGDVVRTQEIDTRETVTYKKNGKIEESKIVEKDEVLKTIHHEKVMGCKVKHLPPRAEIQEKKSIDATGYALQLFGSFELNDVKRLQKNLDVDKSAVIWHAENQKKDWYVLMYGHYETVADAKSAMKQMPKHLRDMGPWVRGLEGLG